MAADINGDGKPDLISANYYGNSLSLLTNKGNGSFKLFSTIATTSPSSVVAADFNGDGKVDLACANVGTDTVSTFTNKGLGMFLLASTCPVGHRPMDLVAPDINNDGKPDFVTANYYDYPASDTLSVLTNDGSAQFVTALTPVVQGPYSVAFADLNEDGFLDLISPGEVLTNNGSMGFAASPFPYVAGAPQKVIAADMNSDGHVDLITVNYVGDSLSVVTNNGHGGFAIASSMHVGGSPKSVATADVNGDGKLDLIAGNIGGNIYIDNVLTILTNDGSGGFVLATTMLASGPWCVIATDVNSDSKQDLVVADWALSKVAVFINVPTLHISRSDETVSVSWPSSWMDWMLQQGGDLSGTNWTNYGGIISDNGTNKTATSPALQGNSFFRLIHP